MKSLTRDQHNLPPLHTATDVENLNDEDLVRYLTGYGVDSLPVGPNPLATNEKRKVDLKFMIGLNTW